MPSDEHKTRVAHRELIKPHGALSHTDWLTNAVDAEEGMTLVVYDSGEQLSQKITQTYIENGRMWIKTDAGNVYAAARINYSEKMVIE